MGFAIACTSVFYGVIPEIGPAPQGLPQAAENRFPLADSWGISACRETYTTVPQKESAAMKQTGSACARKARFSLKFRHSPSCQRIYFPRFDG